MTPSTPFSLTTCAAIVAIGLPLSAGAQASGQGAVATSSLGLLSSRSSGPTFESAASTPGSAWVAQDLVADDPEGDTRFEFNTWFWMVGFTGDITARGRTSEIDANFADVLDASDSLGALSGRIEYGYGKFAGYFDGMYAKLGADDQSGPGGLAEYDVTLTQGIIDFGLMYRILDTEPTGAGADNFRNMTLDLYAGARYNSLELEIDSATLGDRSASKSWFDPIIGAKYGLPLSERWVFKVNADIGGFGLESDFTWSTTGVFGYDFEVLGVPATVMAGYRAISWDYSEGSGAEEFEYDIIQHGPIVGMNFRF